jgi:NAD(P)-dependent dehydrogenase (short-subunit alcohol dehydrogenase family)
MRLNYLGSVFTAKAAAPAMVRYPCHSADSMSLMSSLLAAQSQVARGCGHIVFIASGAAAASFLGYSSYAPTKFGMVQIPL